MQEGLSKAREKIDRIDGELVKLVLERLAVSRDVALAKREHGDAIFDPAREREILSRVTGQAGPENELAAKIFFTTLFSLSKARQRGILRGESPLTAKIAKAAADYARPFPTRAFVACCGAEGSYAQQAVSRMVGIPTILFFHDFESVFEAVEKGVCRYGVLPIENSAVGSVTAVYDLMQKHSFYIVRTIRLKVDHALLAKHGAALGGIKRIKSHPHALAQCAGFLKSQPGVEALPAPNTAVAAKELAESGDMETAVIASRNCAELYGLDVLEDRIQDVSYNYTRFICISKSMEIYPGANKISLMLSLPHRPGALNSIISKFAAIDVNLTKLESRPVPGMDFEFRFTFDFEAPPMDASVLSLISELSQDPSIEHFTFLGAYAEK